MGPLQAACGMTLGKALCFQALVPSPVKWGGDRRTLSPAGVESLGVAVGQIPWHKEHEL